MSRYACYVSSFFAVTCLVVLISGGLTYYGLEIERDAGDISNLPLFQERNCTVSNVTVFSLVNCYYQDSTKGRKYSSRYVSVWKDSVSGYSIIISPLSAQVTMNEAQSQSQLFANNFSYPCMCNVKRTSLFPKVTNYHKCSIWDACIFDVNYVHNLQNDEHVDYKKGYAMFVVGVSMTCVFLMSLFVFTLCLCRKRCFCCTCRKDGVEYTILTPQSVKRERKKECNKQRDIYYRNYRENIVNNPAYLHKWVCVVNNIMIGPFLTREDAEKTALETYHFGGYVTLVGKEAIVDTFQPDDLYT